MKHHPVVIITSNPSGMTQAIKKLEQDGYEVKVLDSLSANLIDFFGAISQTDPDSFVPVTDDLDKEEGGEPPSDPNEDSSETTEMPVGDTSVPAEVSDDAVPATTEPAAEQIFSGTINDEEIEIHEVDGTEIVLHPVSVEGSGSKIKFNLSESIEMILWESEDIEPTEEGMSEVEVHLVIADLNIDATVKIKISEMTMTPPVILMGSEWYANFQSEPVTEKT